MYSASIFESGRETPSTPHRVKKPPKKLQTAYADSKGADQPVHPCSQINAAVVQYLERIIN